MGDGAYIGTVPVPMSKEDERTIALAGNDVVARQVPHGTRTIDINDARAVADAVLDHLSRVRSGQV